MATGKRVRTVLAAVADPAAPGQAAARKAVEIAWLFDADVVLYHSCYDSTLATSAFFDTQQRIAARRELIARAMRDLRAVADSLRESEIEVRVRVEWKRNVPEAIARAAVLERADLVVAEPRYRSMRRRRGLSHVDWEVARLCPAPLLLVRSAAPYTKPRILAAVDPGGHGLRVAALDAAIVGLGATLADATDGTIRVIHCVRQPPLGLAVRSVSVRHERDRVTKMVRQIAHGSGVSDRDVRILDGHPVDALIDAVNAEDADVLVMGTVVRGAVREALIGSTTEQVMHVAPCDLLLIRPGTSRLPLRRARR